MRGYGLILVVLLLVVSIPVVVIACTITLKFLMRLFEKLSNRLFDNIPPSHLVYNKTAFRIGKLIFEVLIGLAIFSTCLTVFLRLPSLLLFAIGDSWSDSCIVQVVLIVFSFSYSILLTYKVLQLVHRHFNLNEQTK